MIRFQLLGLCLFFVLAAHADIRLPQIFGDNMVLQRGKPIAVWGWANAGENVTVQMNGQTTKTKAGRDGKWKVSLSSESAGGPYSLIVSGKNKVALSNVMVGEVWLCSGQSNMEMSVAGSANAAQEMSTADFPMIRHIKVPNRISGMPLDDLSGKANWEVASPSTAGNFSAVGYFFARKLYQELKVPIGLINASWGGTMVETWISHEALQASPEFKNVFGTTTFANMESRNEEAYQALVKDIESKEGTVAGATAADWKMPAFNHEQWRTIDLPINFDLKGLAKFDGTIWFRKTIILDKTATEKDALLNLHTIDDADETYVNGQLVGKTEAYNAIRQYTVPASVLKEGANVIAIKVRDDGSNGGFFGNASQLNLVCGTQIIPLAGEWHYKIEKVSKAAVNPNSYPTLLFNSMIHPILPYPIKGVIWYQGETNAGRAYQYRTAFPLLINDWRQQFKQADLPFYFVQLASYRAGGGNSNAGSNWAELREAQAMTLSLPNTGMAVALDIGETDDIHPKNKQDVGLRLAAAALSKTYGGKEVYSGPVFQSMQQKGGQIQLTFTNSSNGFLVKDKYGYIKGFEIAGADQKFYPAKAMIEQNKVVVFADAVVNPVSVRYGWADDMPEANLYNKEGFPTVPFRTDTWKTITANEKYTVVL